MRWVLLGVLILQAATCGQTGPLTLPEEREQTQPVQSLALADISRSLPPAAVR